MTGPLQARAIVTLGKFEEVQTDDGDMAFIGTLAGNRCVLRRDPDKGQAKIFWSLTVEGRVFTMPTIRRRVSGPIPPEAPGFPEERDGKRGGDDA